MSAETMLGLELPPAVLLLGADMDESLRTAAAVLHRRGVQVADRLALGRLSADDARHVVRWAHIAPFGTLKVAVIVLDGATAQAQNIILKALEEPHPVVRFLLAATARPLPTIVYRCQVVHIDGLEPEPDADGDVAKTVAIALRCAAAADLRGLDVSLASWGRAHHELLMLSLATGAIGNGTGSLSTAQARKLLGALSRYADAHPRLAAHAALLTLVDKEHHA